MLFPSAVAHPNPSPATGFWRAYPPRGAAACRSARAEPRSAFFKQSHADDLQGGAVYAHLQAQRRGSMAARRCARRTVLGWPALGRAEDTCGNLLRSTLCAARALEKRRHNSELPVLFGLSDASRNVSPACVRRVVAVSGAGGRVQATGRACPWRSSRVYSQRRAVQRSAATIAAAHRGHPGRAGANGIFFLLWFAIGSVSRNTKSGGGRQRVSTAAQPCRAKNRHGRHRVALPRARLNKSAQRQGRKKGGGKGRSPEGPELATSSAPTGDLVTPGG